jgi:hypothetical protein
MREQDSTVRLSRPDDETRDLMCGPFLALFLLLFPCGHLRPFFSYTASMSRYNRPSHEVYMYFFKRGGWQVQFLEADLKT